MEKILNLSFCDITIYDNFLVVKMNEGVLISPESNKVLKEIAEVYFFNKPFVYITHRVNSYSVDPSVYKGTASIENLVAFAVVANTHLASENAKIEKLFFKDKPFEIFSDLEKAKDWAKSILNNK